MIKAKIVRSFRLEVEKPSSEDKQRIARKAADLVRDRVQKKHLDSNDQKLPPYSKSGPYYAKRGKLFDKGLPTQFYSILSGRGQLTLTQLKAAVRRGAVPPDIFGWIRGRKSVKFKDYKAFRESIGKTGVRDLTLTGDMWEDFDIVRINLKSITVGFDKPSQQKAAFLEKLHRFIMLSPTDMKSLKDYVEKNELSVKLRVRQS